MGTALQGLGPAYSCGALALDSHIDDALPVWDGGAQLGEASSVVFCFHFNGGEGACLNGFHGGDDDHECGSFFHEALTSSSSSQWVV